DGVARFDASRLENGCRGVDRLRPGTTDDRPVTLSIPHQQRLPLAIAALGLLFLGVFLVYPLLNVFGASVLDSEGQSFTFANYTKMLGRPFYRAAVVNTLGIGALATVITTMLAVPLAFALARLPIPGKAAILALAALLILTTALVLLIQRHFLSSRRFATNTRQAPPILRIGPGLRIAATLYCWAIVLLALVPFFAIVALSFLEFRGPVLHGNFSLANFTLLFGRDTRPLANTLVFASAAALCVTLAGVPIGYVVTRYRASIATVLDVVATLP